MHSLCCGCDCGGDDRAGLRLGRVHTPGREAPERGGRGNGLAPVVTVHKLWGVTGFCFPGGLFFLTLIFCPSSSGVQGAKGQRGPQSQAGRSTPLPQAMGEEVVGEEEMTGSKKKREEKSREKKNDSACKQQEAKSPKLFWQLFFPPL